MTTAYMERIIYLTNTMFKAYERQSEHLDTAFGFIKRLTNSFGRDTELSLEKRLKSSGLKHKVNHIGQPSNLQAQTDSEFKSLVEQEIASVLENLEDLYTKHQSEKASLEKYLELYRNMVDKVFQDYDRFDLLDTPIQKLEQDAYLMLAQSMTHYLVENDLKSEPLYNQVHKFLYSGPVYDYLRKPELAKDKASAVKIQLRGLRERLTGHFVNSEQYNALTLECAKAIATRNEDLVKTHATVLSPEAALPKYLQIFTQALPSSLSLHLSRDKGALGKCCEEVIRKIETLRAVSPGPESQPLSPPSSRLHGALLLEHERKANPGDNVPAKSRVPLLSLFKSEASRESRADQEPPAESKEQEVTLDENSQLENMLSHYLSQQNSSPKRKNSSLSFK